MEEFNKFLFPDGIKKLDKLEAVGNLYRLADDLSILIRSVQNPPITDGMKKRIRWFLDGVLAYEFQSAANNEGRSLDFILGLAGNGRGGRVPETWRGYKAAIYREYAECFVHARNCTPGDSDGSKIKRLKEVVKSFNDTFDVLESFKIDRGFQVDWFDVYSPESYLRGSVYYDLRVIDFDNEDQYVWLYEAAICNSWLSSGPGQYDKETMTRLNKMVQILQQTPEKVIANCGLPKWKPGNHFEINN